MLLTTFWEVVGALSIMLFIFLPIVLLWGFSLTDLFRRRDIRWRKVLWLLGILVFPIIGSLVYLATRAVDYATEAYSDGESVEDRGVSIY
jgi:hypothetical protein